VRVERNGIVLDVEVTDDDEHPLLYLHGLGGLGRDARAETPSGYRVAVFDQCGHGGSTPCTDPDRYAIEELVADAIAVLDLLGWQHAAIGGTSMGAAVALRLTQTEPGRVAEILLAAPAFGDRPNLAIPRFEGMADAIQQTGVEGMVAAMRESGVPDEGLARLERWAVHDRASIVTALRTVGRWVPFPDLDVLRTLGVPARVVAWGGDDMHPAELAQRLAERLAAPLHEFASADDVLRDRTEVARAYEELAI
jgi:pimeloyl-ACP methyl ester carboxylesterase